MRYLLSVGVVALIAAALVSTPRAQEVKPEAKDLSTANNKFGIELLKRLHADGQNTFLSPSSIGMALQMTSRGAKGDTLAEMNSTMHVENLEVGDANRKLLDALSGRDDVKLKIANAIWADPAKISLNRGFADAVGKEFDAEISALSFSDPNAKETINKWVSERTETKIPKLLETLDASTVCVLVNAIYFKGEWTIKFDKEKTKKADFNRVDGTMQIVQMMNSEKGKYRYLDNDDVQVVALPYGPHVAPASGPSGKRTPDEPGENAKMHMWLVVPKEGKSLDSVVKAMNAETFQGWHDAARRSTGTVSLPRFKMKFKKELQDDLPEMGMKLAFTPKADLSGFDEGQARNSLFIARVIHEAVIEVNEEGTVAAAATAVTAERGAPPKAFHVNCNRPFLVAISDETTGAILFIGTCYNPESE